MKRGYGDEFETYWNESAVYLLRLDGAKLIEEATYELHSMCLEVVDEVVHSEELMDRFEIDDHLRHVL